MPPRRLIPLSLSLLLAIPVHGWAQQQPSPATSQPHGAAPASQPSEFEATAEVAVVGGNVVSARRRALGLARRLALRQAAEHLLSPEQVAQHEAVLGTAVFRRYALYIQRYRVAEENSSGGRFTVRVAVTVHRKRLLSDLQRLLRLDAGSSAHSIRQLICVHAATGTPSTLVSRCVKHLGAAGYQVRVQSVTPATAACAVRVMLSLADRPAEGVRGLGLAGAAATVKLQALFPPDAAQQLVQADAVGWGATPAAARSAAHHEALQRAAAALVAKLSPRLPPLSLGSGETLMRVRGLSSAAQLEAIIAFLRRRVPGVRRVLPRRFDAGAVALRVSGSTPAALARAVAGHEFGQFKLKLERSRGGLLWFRIDG